MKTLLSITAVLLILLLPLAAEAQTGDAVRITRTTPRYDFDRLWQSWPPSGYDTAWPRVEPRTREIYSGDGFSWLAADYEIFIEDGWLELWQSFGGQPALILETPVDEEHGILLMRHPWRGPQLLMMEQDHILKVVYPVNYYLFQEAWLAKNVDPDAWIRAEIARSGPVILFMRGRQRVLATYNGLGYNLLVHDPHVSNKDSAALVVNSAGEAVIAWTEIGRLNVQWIGEGGSLRSEQLRDYRSGNAWEITDTRRGLILQYETTRGVKEHLLESAVYSGWW